MPFGRHGWRGHLRGRGYRITLAREAILNVLDRENKHLSAKEIYIRALNIDPDVGLTTVYRTLEMLSGMGIINKLEIGDKTTRYEINYGNDKKHYHLICVRCGKVIDYEDLEENEKESVKRIHKDVYNKFGFDIKSYEVKYFGICKECK